jgi:capsular exopolysaccharide synthesis family protein
MTLPVPSLPHAQSQLQPQGFGPYAAPFGMAQPAPIVSAEQRLELLEYWRSITKRKWAILALVAVVALVAGVIAYGLTPVYRATATVFIEPGKVNVVSIAEVYTTNQQQNLQTQSEILRSRKVAERTARELKLWDHPAFDPRQAKPSWRAQLMGMFGAKQAKPVWTQENLEKATIGALTGRLVVEPVRNSQLLRVSFESEDPVLAATVINTAVNQYINGDREARMKVAQQVSSYLQERLGSLRENLLKSEQALQAYREQNGIVSLGGSAQALPGRQFGDSADRLLAARARRLELESAYEQARASKPADYAAIPAIARNATVAETLKQMDTAQRNLSVMQETLSAGHYKVQQAQGELAQLQKLLVQQSTAAVAALRAEYDAARSIETSFERTLGIAKGGVQEVNRDEFRLAVLERDVAGNRQLYELFMSRSKETNVAGDVQGDVARMIDEAMPSYGPVRPDKMGIILRAALVALVLGAIASLLMDRLDNTIKGGDDAELRLRLPVLTALPMVESTDRAHMARLFLDESHSHYAEGIRTARTGVLLSSLDVAHKILLITSTLPGEGKTTVAVNLAMAHSQTKRTLLIDADMRRSQVGRALGIPAGLKGLTNLVAGNASAEECIVTVKDTTLQVMPVGDLPPNPLELLLSQRFKDVLKHLSEHFEMIIIDSPPVELVSEALVLAPLCTNVAFVAKAMSTPAPLMRKSITRIQRAGGNILGVIVNQLDFKHAQRYYGEYGAGSYNYGGYGYGSYGGTPRLTKASRGASDKTKTLPQDTVG